LARKWARQDDASESSKFGRLYLPAGFSAVFAKPTVINPSEGREER
jgi:hypothetical protein